MGKHARESCQSQQDGSSRVLKIQNATCQQIANKYYFAHCKDRTGQCDRLFHAEDDENHTRHPKNHTAAQTTRTENETEQSEMKNKTLGYEAPNHTSSAFGLVNTKVTNLTRFPSGRGQSFTPIAV